MRKLTFLIVAAAPLICSAPAFARPNKHAQAGEFVPCSTANDGALVCGESQVLSTAPHSDIRTSSLELANTARPLTSEQQAVCHDMLRAFPGHQAAYEDAKREAKGKKTTYDILVSESVLALDGLIAIRCSGGEQPLDDDIDDQPSARPMQRIAVR